MKFNKLMLLLICCLIMVAFLLSCERPKITAEKALSFVPKDSSLVIVVDMKKVAATEFYNKIQAEEKAFKNYNKFMEKTGIDPQTDIDKLIISITEIPNKDEPYMVALAFGRFNKEKMLSSIKEESEVIIEEYQGIYLYIIEAQEEVVEESEEQEGEVEEGIEEEAEEEKVEAEINHRDYLLAILEESLIAAGDSDYVKEVIDLYQGKGESIEQNQAFMEVINEANQVDMVWGAGLVPDHLKEKAEENPMSKSLAAVTSVVFSLNIDRDLDALITLKADTVENARNLMNTINGFIALGRLGSTEQPDLLEFLDGITVEGMDTTVTIAVYINEDLMTRLKVSKHQR